MVRKGIAVGVGFGIQEFKNYFEERGGRKGVKDRDPIWVSMFKFLNDQNSGKKGYKKLTGSCGECRSRAFKILNES